MDLLQFLIEVLGLVIPGILTWMVTQIYPIGHLSFLTSIPKDQHKNIIIAIPVAVYAIGRVYFGIMYFVMSKLPAGMSYKPTIDRVISTLSIATAFLLPFVHPLVFDTTLRLYNENLAELTNVVIEASKPEFEKAKLFGYKIVMLLLGWFALLFVFELLLRVVLMLIRGVVMAVMGKPKNTEATEKKVKAE